jgi:hypothetical protein
MCRYVRADPVVCASFWRVFCAATTSADRLTGGAIASLSRIGLLVIFMIQITDDVIGEVDPQER